MLFGTGIYERLELSKHMTKHSVANINTETVANINYTAMETLLLLFIC